MDPERIRSELEQALAERELFLVDLVVSHTNRITVYIDKMSGGISVDDCAGISRFLESKLDRNLQDFDLEVSSPGTERALLLPLQFTKHAGREIDVLRTDGIRHSGRLMETSDTGIKLMSEKRVKDKKSGKSRKVSDTLEINFDLIKKATIIFSK